MDRDAVARAEGTLRRAVPHAKTRDEWVEFFAGHEVCFAPVLLDDAKRARTRTTSPASTFIDVDGAPQPAPAPRFSRTPSAVQRAPVAAGTDTDTALVDWGFTAEEVASLKEQAQSPSVPVGVKRTVHVAANRRRTGPVQGARCLPSCSSRWCCQQRSSVFSRFVAAT